MIHRQLSIAILNSNTGSTMLRQRHIPFLSHCHPRPLALWRLQLVRGYFQGRGRFGPISWSVLPSLLNKFRLWSPFGGIEKLFKLLALRGIYQESKS